MEQLANRDDLLAQVKRELIKDLGDHLKDLYDNTKKHRSRNRFLRFILARYMTSHLDTVISDFNTTRSHLQIVLNVANFCVAVDTNEQVRKTNKGLRAIIKELRKIVRCATCIHTCTYVYTYICIRM
jgi:hypothetical protein